MKSYIKLMRPKHYIKNGLVFAALICSGRLFELDSLLLVIWGTILFCLLSSVVYILNDIKDADSDRHHESKRRRPIASGDVPVQKAYALMFILIAVIAATGIFVYDSVSPPLLLSLYLVLNIGYSVKLKHVAIFDIVILMSGFLIRVIYGALIIGQPISHWLYLTVMSLSFYMTLGKRRNELIRHGRDASEVRKVLKDYGASFLDKNMYVCMALSIVFYSLWTMNPITPLQVSSERLIWTVPFVIIIFMRYSQITETAESADPGDVLLGDKPLLSLSSAYAAVMAILLYGDRILGFFSGG